MFRADDSQGFLNPVSEEDTLNSPEEDERGQDEANGETQEQILTQNMRSLSRNSMVHPKQWRSKQSI